MADHRREHSPPRSREPSGFSNRVDGDSSPPNRHHHGYPSDHHQDYREEEYHYYRRSKRRVLTKTLDEDTGIRVSYTVSRGLRRTIGLLTLVLLIIILVIVILLVYYVPKARQPVDDDAKGASSSQYRYQNAAIATDSGTCSDIGREVLQEGGSAVDAAIAALLCIGTMNPNNIGIGGGRFLMHYDASRKEMSMYDAREVAPLGATEDMFVNDTEGRSGRDFFGSGDPDISNNFNTQDSLGLTYHRIVEAFKFGFGQRGGLADSSFVNVDDLVNKLISRRTADDITELIKDNDVYDNEFYGNILDTLDDRGTSHLSVIDSNGNAVSVTATLNFGKYWMI